MMARSFLALSVRGIDKKAFFISNMQKYLKLLAPSKKFFEEESGKFFDFIWAFIFL